MAGSVRIRDHVEQWPATRRAMSAGTGEPSENVPGSSDWSSSDMSGTVMIIRA